jgi:hypothetical protein
MSQCGQKLKLKLPEGLKLLLRSYIKGGVKNRRRAINQCSGLKRGQLGSLRLHED